MDINKTKGVYFVANDRVIEMTIAFLNSFRNCNPEIPLCLIPFRSDVDKLCILQEKYNFSVFNNLEALSFCDDISRQFHGEIKGHYRKLVIWDGPFDEFVYIDVDMLVMKNIDFVFQILKQYDFITSHSNLPSIEKWVWKDTIYSTDLLNQEKIRYAANTGFIVSKKNVILIDEIKAKLPSALKLKPYMELRCKDQSFINYLIVTSNKRFTSLFVLLDSPLYPENYIEFWAGNNKRELMKNMQTSINGKLYDLFLIHWAGKWQLKQIEKKLFVLLNILRIRRTIWSISLFMPFKKLWKHYRLMDPGKSKSPNLKHCR